MGGGQQERIDMKCPSCGRSASWTKTRCRTCKTRLIQWYILAAALFLLGCYGSFIMLEAVL
jgi:uncharacterized OB-fold protein